MKETNKVYVDIQSLLDLRQSVLFNLYDDKEQLADFLLSDEYNFRTRDVFNNIDQNKYEALLKEASTDLLSGSSVTYILNTLKSKISNLEKRNNFYNETKIPEILLNVYPFKLTDEEIEHIKNLLFYKLEANCIINVINLSTKDISPYFINNMSLVTCFIYDFTEWMSIHVDSLEGNKNTDTIIYFPSLSKVDLDEESITKFNKLGFKDIFSYTEYLFSSYANISFLPVLFYSNITTATAHLSKFDNILKDKKLENEESNIDLSKIDLPEGL